jgi:hypothetical protein
MTDAPLAFRVYLGALRPACPAAEAAVKALGERALCGVRITRSSRNLKRLRLYRMMLAVAAPLLAEQVPGLTAADLHDIVRRKLRLGDEIRLPSGERHFRPHSTSFATMDEATFAAHVNRVDALLSRWLNCPPGQVIDEARARLGGDDGGL